MCLVHITLSVRESTHRRLALHWQPGSDPFAGTRWAKPVRAVPLSFTNLDERTDEWLTGIHHPRPCQMGVCPDAMTSTSHLASVLRFRLRRS